MWLVKQVAGTNFGKKNVAKIKLKGGIVGYTIKILAIIVSICMSTYQWYM